MKLADIFNSCQGDRVDDWRLIPAGDPGTDLLAGLVDLEESDRPALAALDHRYRAVYVPDARVGLGWGMETTYTREWRGQRPDWADSDWGDPVEPNLAHILLNGTVVWRVRYTYINRGAGCDGLLPWPAREYECVEALEHRAAGWNTTRWEVEFVRLLSDLQGIDDWDFDEALRGWGLRIYEESPLGPDEGRDE